MKKIPLVGLLTMLCMFFIGCNSNLSGITASMNFDKSMPFQLNDPIGMTLKFRLPAPGESVDTGYGLQGKTDFDPTKADLYAFICTNCTGGLANGPYFVRNDGDTSANPDPSKYPLDPSFEVITPPMGADRLTATTPVKASYDPNSRIVTANFTFKVVKSLPNRDFIHAGFFAMPVGVSPKEWNKAIGISTAMTLVSTN
jgi:hypothetical protein